MRRPLNVVQTQVRLFVGGSKVSIHLIIRLLHRLIRPATLCCPMNAIANNPIRGLRWVTTAIINTVADKSVPKSGVHIQSCLRVDKTVLSIEENVYLLGLVA